MSIRSRGKSQYEVRVGRKRDYVGTFKTKKEAEKAERDAITAIDNGEEIKRSKLTVGELVDRFIENRRAMGKGAKTIEEYAGVARLYIAPHLGTEMIQRLRPAAVSSWLAKILEKGGRKERSISPKTAKHAFALLSSALRYGVKMEIVGRNVCAAVDPPAQGQSKANALSEEQIAKIVRASVGSRWEHFVSASLALGTRRGELLALSWPDVDLEAGQVVVRASMSQTKAAVVMKSTKTNRVRVVPLSQNGRAVFRRQRALQAVDRLKAGEHYRNATDAVFTDEIGDRLSPKAATNAFARLAKKAGVSITSLHSTRHTAATSMIAGGVDIRTAAAILGHSNPSVTLGLYSHVVEGQERAAIDVLADRLERAVRKPEGSA